MSAAKTETIMRTFEVKIVRRSAGEDCWDVVVDDCYLGFGLTLASATEAIKALQERWCSSADNHLPPPNPKYKATIKR